MAAFGSKNKVLMGMLVEEVEREPHSDVDSNEPAEVVGSCSLPTTCCGSCSGRAEQRTTRRLGVPAQLRQCDAVTPWLRVA